jgi:uncharacterized protein DUF4398
MEVDMNATRFAAIVGFVMPLVAACSSPPAPATELRAASGAVRAAEERGAATEPRASLHLAQARDALTAAERDIADEKMDHARMLLESAKADAELALVYARVGGTRREAARLTHEAEAFEHEINRVEEGKP